MWVVPYKSSCIVERKKKLTILHNIQTLFSLTLVSPVKRHELLGIDGRLAHRGLRPVMGSN